MVKVITFLGNASFVCVLDTDLVLVDDAYNYFFPNEVCPTLQYHGDVVHVNSGIPKGGDERTNRRKRIAYMLSKALDYMQGDDYFIVHDSDVYVPRDIATPNGFSTITVPVLNKDYRITSTSHLYLYVIPWKYGTNYVVPHTDVERFKQVLAGYNPSQPVDVYLSVRLIKHVVTDRRIVHYKLLCNNDVNTLYDVPDICVDPQVIRLRLGPP